MRAEYIPADRLKRIVDHLQPVDRLIADLCLATGARINDVLTMRVWQLKQEDKQVIIMEDKTDNIRIVSIEMDLVNRLIKHCKGKHRFNYIFPGQLRPGKRKKINRSTFWRHFVSAADMCGYKENVYTPHSLRKVYAVRKLESTRSLVAVQKDMGHKHLSTTMLYALSDRMDDLGLY